MFFFHTPNFATVFFFYFFYKKIFCSIMILKKPISMIFNIFRSDMMIIQVIGNSFHSRVNAVKTVKIFRQAFLGHFDIFRI